jgi:hypothetical protein
MVSSALSGKTLEQNLIDLHTEVLAMKLEDNELPYTHSFRARKVQKDSTSEQEFR